MTKFITVNEAVNLINDGQTVGIGGFCGFGAPNTILKEMGNKHQKCNSPKALTIVSSTCSGDGEDNDLGISALSQKGQIAKVISSAAMMAPVVAERIAKNEIACYFIPLGVFSGLFRAGARGEDGYITRVGLNTFCDPRIEGAKVNKKAKEENFDLVKVVRINNKDRLLYNFIKMDYALLRGTYADREGNITICEEAVRSEVLEMANAVHNNGGKVIVEIKALVDRIDPRDVCIHKSSVDYICLSTQGTHFQCYGLTEYHPEYVGEKILPLEKISPLKHDLRKIIARRGFMEIEKGMVVNLGKGISEGISIIANEEGVIQDINLSMETGILGGVPLNGVLAGGGINPEALYKMADNFDFYDGGGLDITFLSGAEIDEEGNVNVSRFANRIVGPGGFINISQNTKKVNFLGTFTAGKNDIAIKDDGIVINKDGEGIKFVKKVDQITFSGKNAIENGQIVKYISERCVFELTPNGLMLTEIAKGVDIKKDILAKMQFTPKISENVKYMDSRIFKNEKMNITLKTNENDI